MKKENTKQSIKFSKNAKLNAALKGIYEDLQDMGVEEVKRYREEFPFWVAKDHNIAQYGNLLVYFNDIRKFYKKCGYTSFDKWSDQKVWELYLQQVGYVARHYFD